MQETPPTQPPTSAEPPEPQQQEPTLAPEQQEQQPAQGTVLYGRYLKRSVAYFLDGIILSIINGLVAGLFGFTGRAAGFALSSTGTNPSASAALSGTSMILNVVLFIVTLTINLGYSVGFLVSRGATPGKMALGLMVVDTQLGKLTLGKALLRETIGKFVSGMVLGLGYLWVIWDDKKQGWHDKIANTLVVEKKSLPTKS